MKTKFIPLFFLAVVALQARAGDKHRLGDLRSKLTPDAKSDAADDKSLSPEERKKVVADVADEFYKKGLAAMAEDPARARVCFQRALALQPENAPARDALRRLDAPQPAAPKKSAVPALPARPASATKPVKERLASEFNRLVAQGSLDRAHAIGEKILAANPRNESVKKKMAGINGELYWRSIDRAQEREKAGDIDSAVEAYQAALTYKADPVAEEIIDSLTEKKKTRDRKASQEIYMAALRTSQNGNFEQALQLCKKSIRLNPDNLQAQKMLERLQSKLSMKDR